MAKQYETVIGLEVHGINNENENFLRLLNGIWRCAKYSYLSGVYRYAGFSAGIK